MLPSLLFVPQVSHLFHKCFSRLLPSYDANKKGQLSFFIAKKRANGAQV